MSELSVVFMGTPEFAVSILERLLQDGIRVKAVVTAPDKPSGRGLKVHESAVKQKALEHNLPILQPVKLKDPEFLGELEALHADLFVVVAFRMLPKEVWNMPPKGTINLHASLLPNYRGAAPINWAIINGEQKTGVSTFFLNEEIDTGAIIEQAETAIGENETVGELYSRLMSIGADLVSSSLKKIESGQVQAVEQTALDLSQIKRAPKIFREDCEIDLSKSAQEVHNHIRGLSPYPAAWMNWKDKNGDTKVFKIYKSELSGELVGEQKLIGKKDEILLACADEYIRILEIQAEGKRRMSAKDFLLGNVLEDYSI